MTPVAGSIIICCSVDVVDETTMPRVDPGAAICGSLFALGAPSRIVMICRFELSRCFFTNTSSCEKAHSSADIRAVLGGGVIGLCGMMFGDGVAKLAVGIVLCVFG